MRKRELAISHQQMSGQCDRTLRSLRAVFYGAVWPRRSRFAVPVGSRAAALPPGLTMAERARNGGSPRSRAGELRIERPGNKVIVGGVVGAPARWRRRRFGMTSAWLGVVCHTIGSSSKASLEGHDRWSPSLPSDLPMDCADGRRVGCGGYLPPLLITSVPWRGDRVARRNRPTSIEGAIEMNAGNPASTPRRQLLWLCSRCGLSITPRARWLAIEHCPRCMARAHLPVRLISHPTRHRNRAPPAFDADQSAGR